MTTATVKTFEETLWYFQLECPNYVRLFEEEFIPVVDSLSRFQRITPFFEKSMEKALRKYQRGIKLERRKTLMGQLRRQLSLMLVEGAVHRFSDSPPKVHHWTPLCYLRNFTRDVQQSNSRGALIPSVSFAEEEATYRNLHDKDFAHRPVKGKGFYQLSAEYFLGLAESRYSNVMLRMREGVELNFSGVLSLLTMMLVQHLRSPQFNGEFFPLKSIADFSEAAIGVLDSFDFDGHAYIETAGAPYYFSPHTPTRMRRFVDGSRAWHFPLSSEKVFIFAERPLTEAERVRMAEGSQLSATKQARRMQRELYGAIESDFTHSD